MTTSIPRFATAGVIAIAITLAACGSPDPGVEAGRSDRTRTASSTTTATEPAATTASTTVPDTTAPSTEPPVTDPPATDPPSTEPAATERPPAPAASGSGSVSADDLDSVFLPSNPDLLVPSSELTDGIEPPAFLDDEMTFSGMDPVIEIAGAPITLWSYFLTGPEFDDDGNVTAASRFSVGYRMAVQVENEDIDGFAEQLRDELRPVVEAANPGDTVADTIDEAPLGNSIFGLLVGSESNPTTRIEIQQHYVIVPRLVEDLLLSVRVTRSIDGDVIDPAQLPNRNLLVNEPLEAQIGLFEQVDAPAEPSVLLSHRMVANIPSAGSPAVNRFVDYAVPLPDGGFEDYVAAVAAVVEADVYDGVENFGDTRSFTHAEQRNQSEFAVTRVGDDGATVAIQGDVIAYPG